MASDAINPLEALTERFAHEYVLDVKRYTKMFAPVRPWWTAKLSADAQLWRWEAPDGAVAADGTKISLRDAILPWLMTATAHMGAKDAKEALDMIEDIFTSVSAPDLIPPEVVAQIPPELLEMVQAAGPEDAAKHIRKMERMHEGRMQAVAVLAQTNQPDVPEPPDVPPMLPTEMQPGTAGWPLYGNAPQQPEADHGQQSEPSLAGH